MTSLTEEVSTAESVSIPALRAKRSVPAYCADRTMFWEPSVGPNVLGIRSADGENGLIASRRARTYINAKLLSTDISFCTENGAPPTLWARTASVSFSGVHSDGHARLPADWLKQ